jgi:hypothetical protein
MKSMPPESAVTVTPPGPVGLLRAVSDELQREDQRLLYPLMTRMNEVAEALGQGVAVDPDYIDEGLRLWSRYVNEVHLHRVERLYGVFQDILQLPAAAGEAAHRRGSRFRAEKKPAAREATSLDKYNEIRGTQVRMAERLLALKGLAEGYRRGEYYSPQMLASLLRSGAFSDRAWGKYEEEFVQKYLNEQVSAEEEARLRKEVVVADEIRGRVETEVRKFLGGPIPQRKSPG